MRNVMFMFFTVKNGSPVYTDSTVVDMDTRTQLKYTHSVNMKTTYDHMCSFKVGKIISNINANATRKYLKEQGLKISDSKFIDTLWDFVEIPQLSRTGSNRLLYLFCYRDFHDTNSSLNARTMAKACMFYAEKGLKGIDVLDFELSNVFDYLSHSVWFSSVSFSKLTKVFDCIAPLLSTSEKYSYLSEFICNQSEDAFKLEDLYIDYKINSLVNFLNKLDSKITICSDHARLLANYIVRCKSTNNTVHEYVNNFIICSTTLELTLKDYLSEVVCNNVTAFDVLTCTLYTFLCETGAKYIYMGQHPSSFYYTIVYSLLVAFPTKASIRLINEDYLIELLKLHNYKGFYLNSLAYYIYVNKNLLHSI